LSNSYKLWYSYLKLRRSQLKNKCISDSEYEEVNDVYERALAYMYKVMIKKKNNLNLNNLIEIIDAENMD
jgi:hypothetical protein